MIPKYMIGTILEPFYSRINRKLDYTDLLSSKLNDHPIQKSTDNLYGKLISASLNIEMRKEFIHLNFQ